MDSARINTIVKEIIELEPSLREHEAYLKTIIADMERVRPTAPLDATFRAALRTKISGMRPPMPSPYANMSWWALRLAPVGAIALLLLIMLPSTQSPTELVEVPEASDPRILNIEIGGTIDTSAERGYGLGGGGEADMSVSAPSMSAKTESMVANQSVRTFTIPPQRPGPSIRLDTLTVPAPSFLVVYEGTLGAERVIGASPLLHTGTAENLSISLKSPTDPAGNYRVALFHDDGDQVFTLRDAPAYDTYGSALSAPLTILSE
jgi:hypothetical protein